MTAVVVSGLAKRYGDIVAVDDVSFEVARGEIFVLLGPNGAGKTTTVEIIEGLRRADEGKVEVLGSDPRSAEVRERIGVMPQSGDLYAGIRTAEALRLFASFYGSATEPGELMERFDLQRVARTPYRRLSGGEKRRLSLAIALVSGPEVAFLDEPTAEMDVEGRAATWTVVRELRDRGAAVLVTTHQLDEAEKVADRVAIMAGGRLVATGTPHQLTSGGPPDMTITLPGPIDADALAAALGASVSPLDGATYRITGMDADPALVSRVTTWLAARGVLLRSMRVGSRSLEEIYMDLTR